MKISRRRLAAASTLALSSLWLPRAARSAEDFPDRPIRIVVPALPGGALDVMARALADGIGKSLPQPVLIDNRPGANWMVGMQAAARAPADGYTLLFVATSGVTINPLAFANFGLDPLAAFTPILMPSQTPFVLLVSPKVPADTLTEFVAYLRAHPGSLNHGSNSVTTILVSELFKQEAGVSYADINYRGAAQVINDTLVGDLQFCFVDLASAAPVLRARSLKALAVTSLQRNVRYPDIPAFAEAGFPGMNVAGATVLLAPAATPVSVLDLLRARFEASLDSPAVRGRFESMGQTITHPSRAEIETLLRQEAAHWRMLITARHISFHR